MDILLTHGYFLYDDPHELAVMRPYPPLGLLYISSHLKAKGFDIGVFDATFASFLDFEQYIERHRPSIVGIYTTLMTKQNVLRMIAFCKRYHITVVLGGPEPPHYANEYLMRGADVIVIGEGELTLEELLPHINRYGLDRLWEIKGIAFLDDVGQVIRTEPRPFIQELSAQPWPDRTAIDLPRYIQIWREHHGVGSTSITCSRGCPYTCTWCSHSVFGESHRRRSPEDVAQEIRWLIDTYAPEQLWFVDDVFTINWRWLKALRDAFEAYDIQIRFECISRADRLNDEVIDVLAEMGCSRLWIGSESGSQRILDKMQRKTRVEAVQKMTHALRQRGIETGMFIMLGYEGETLSDIRATIEHLKTSNPDIFLTTVAYPIKGTRYYQEVEDRIIAQKRWEDRTDRDLGVAGRHSRRYYSFATRWMVSSVQAHKVRHSNSTVWHKWPRWSKHYLSAMLGRVGMMLTARETERYVAPAGRGWYDEKRRNVALD
ncbi:MAG: B12-binding domain-containing radical SAM protein [Phototrophicales bacterium]|nr:MAG: B12-binding domain-containing radical SAM protein [Phototrophicales bacterium]